MNKDDGMVEGRFGDNAVDLVTGGVGSGSLLRDRQPRCLEERFMRELGRLLSVYVGRTSSSYELTVVETTTAPYRRIGLEESAALAANRRDSEQMPGPRNEDE